MNFKLIPPVIVCLGLASSIAFAVETISGEIVDDLYFSDEVKISGITYPDDRGDTKGTSSVDIEGEGSITIGARNGGGFPRIVLWGGTKIESEREWLLDISTKEWWAGTMEAPSNGRLVDKDELEFDISGNHMNSEFVVLNTFAFGRNDSTVAETFSFSPAATVVLPVSVPDFTKVWVAYRDGPDMEDIEEESFCVVQNQLCIVDVSAANEISLIREKYMSCPIKEIDNGTVGDTPYCQYSCDKGYMLNEGLTGCVADGDEDALDIVVVPDEDMGLDGEEERAGGILAGPARQGYLRYTGTNAQRTKIVTDGLQGEELQRALRHNSTVDSRKVEPKEDDSSFMENLQNMEWNIWRWTHREDAMVLPEGGEVNVADAEVFGAEGEIEDAPAHSSAPLLPSTGPAGIFVGISALGIGLMAFSRRRRR